MYRRDSNYMSNESDINALGGLQMNGFLMKTPVGRKASNWSKRYFVLKEGFLLYYAEAEKKCFENKLKFNIHPKGAIPLSYCSIKETTFPGVCYGINVLSPLGNVAISLGAEDAFTQKQWIRTMKKATKLTQGNFNLSETMIESLQTQNSQLTQEKEEYFQKYAEEAKGFRTARQQQKELEIFNQQLEEEKTKIDFLVDQLVQAHDEIKQELNETNNACEILQNDREHLKESTAKLQESITKMTKERNELLERLQNGGNDESTTSPLKEELNEITKTSKSLLVKKLEMETKLKEREDKLEKFIKEKENIETESMKLKLEIENVKREKSITEAVLKDEITIRLNVQSEIEEGKIAVQRLETEGHRSYEKLKSLGKDTSGINQFVKDVKSLKELFENMAKSLQSINTATAQRNRRFSRRYTQIKNLRDVRSTRRGKPLKLLKENQNPAGETTQF